MSFYDIYDSHKEFQKYGNMGIKLTILIPVLQKNKRFSIFTHGGIKKQSYFSQIFPLVFHFIEREFLGGPLKLIESINFIPRSNIWTFANRGFAHPIGYWESLNFQKSLKFMHWHIFSILQHFFSFCARHFIFWILGFMLCFYGDCFKTDLFKTDLT